MVITGASSDIDCAQPDIRASTTHRPNALTVRLWLTARATVLVVTSLLGAALFSLWIAAAAISPLTVVALLVLPATALVRAYANVHRRSAAALLGRPVTAPYRPRRPGALHRVLDTLRDPASWRDAGWLFCHSVVGFVTSVVSVVFFLAGVFYLIFPFLYWVTPRYVFDRPFGDAHRLHSLHESFAVMPVSIVMFTLWWVLVVPLARTEAAHARLWLAAR